MNGNHLQDFLDFYSATGLAHARSPSDILNLAGRNEYDWARDYENNKRRSIRAGKGIDWPIIAKGGGTFESYSPGAFHNWKAPQRLTRAEVGWSFAMAHSSVREQEILMQEGITKGTDEMRVDIFAKIRDEKDMLLAIDLNEGMEDLFYALPDYSTMEVQTDGEHKKPYSFYAHINPSDANAPWGSYTLVNAGTNTTGKVYQIDARWSGDSSWGTANKEGVNPDAALINGKWDINAAGYKSMSHDPATGTDSIAMALDLMFMACKFVKPPLMKQYFEDPNFNNLQISTSTSGRAQFMQSQRAKGQPDSFGYDAGGVTDPTFNGIPIRRCLSHDTIPLYQKQGGSTYVAESALTAATSGTAQYTGARFFFKNGNYMYPVFHAERMFKRGEPSKHHNVPDTTVVPTSVWFQNPCFSYKHQGIVVPFANI